MLRDNRRDDPRISEIVLCRPRDGVVEIGLDLEEPAEIGVEGREQVVELAIAEQHHLYVERNRLRIERLGGDHSEPKTLERLLDADLARLDGALQRFPGEW